MLVVPCGRRRLLGVVVDLARTSDTPPERLVEPLSALEADVPEQLVRLGLWVAAEYVSTPARGLALVLPPGTGTGAARPLRPRRSLRAELTDAGRAALDGAPPGAHGASPAQAGAPPPPPRGRRPRAPRAARGGPSSRPRAGRPSTAPPPALTGRAPRKRALRRVALASASARSSRRLRSDPPARPRWRASRAAAT